MSTRCLTHTPTHTHTRPSTQITLSEALTGFTLPIQHLDGRQILIKTRAGQVLDPQRLWVIDREGMPVRNTGGSEKGALVLNLTVKFPEKLSAAQLKGLGEALGEPENVEKTPEHEEAYLAPYVKRPKQRGYAGRGRGGGGGGGMPQGVHMEAGEGMPGGAGCAHQ